MISNNCNFILTRYLDLSQCKATSNKNEQYFRYLHIYFHTHLDCTDFQSYKK